MELKEIKLESQLVYEGIIVNIRRDKARVISGRVVGREVIEHPPGVAVFAIDSEDRVVMVRQFRYPMNEVVLELPAGKLEDGEDPQTGALRELEEETGLMPDEVRFLGVSYSSPGIMTEKIYLFFARDLKQGPTHPDEDEFVETVRIPLPELMAMVDDGRIPDGKSLAGILKATRLLAKERGEL